MSNRRLLVRRIEIKIDQHGSLRAASRALQIDAAYLCRLKSGQKVPSDKVLKKLGLYKLVRYVEM